MYEFGQWIAAQFDLRMNHVEIFGNANVLKSNPELRHSFSPEALEKMQRAFDRACREMGLTDNSNTALRDFLAKAIVAGFEAGKEEHTLVAAAVSEARQLAGNHA